ncbi:unnamed protein product [Eruca vesicaria subsp. sativa]|uniref:Uncharacterized protein n=1 Tax=Eruca vesicaria subsp. sativa TaxID=29727 RepID=A0ABC8L7P4_ERUVS|nr:unnamed protein product [Eruca vesicaria subsp. sativa]
MAAVDRNRLDGPKIERVDVVVFVIWELVILAFLVFSVVSLYFKRLQLAIILVCVTLLLLVYMKVTKQVRLARKKKRRMLLPLYQTPYEKFAFILLLSEIVL